MTNARDAHRHILSQRDRKRRKAVGIGWWKSGLAVFDWGMRDRAEDGRSTGGAAIDYGLFVSIGKAILPHATPTGIDTLASI